MKEVLTKALVLDRIDGGEADGRLVFFSESFGKISAKAKSLRKIISKSSGHLQPLSFVEVRLNKLSGHGSDFLVLDCVADRDMVVFDTTKRLDLIPFLKILNNFTYDNQVDKALWSLVVDVFKEKKDNKDILLSLFGVLGFDESAIACGMCGKRELSGILKKDKIFVCRSCSLKVGRDNVEYM